MKVKSESEFAQSCLTLHDPMDCSPPGSSVRGIFQARVLERGHTAFSGQCPEGKAKNRAAWLGFQANLGPWPPGLPPGGVVEEVIEGRTGKALEPQLPT